MDDINRRLTALNVEEKIGMIDHSNIDKIKKCGGRGFKSVEDTYKISKIKVAHHINISKDPRIKLVRSFQHYKSKKNFKSTFVEATRYAKEHFKADLSLLEEKSVLSYEQERVELKDDNYRQIQRRLGSILQRLYEERVRNQPWLGFYTVSIQDSDEVYQRTVETFFEAGKTSQI
eukprot:gene11864-2411_t